jgi:RHS repeat-associated protein
LGETSNFYANGRLDRVSRTDSPDTLYVYDDLGNVKDTAQDANGNGEIDYAGSDRITRTGAAYQKLGADWWRVTSNLVWNVDGQNAPLRTSLSRVRMTGLGITAPAWVSPAAILTAQSESVDWRGNVTRDSAYSDASSASVWQVTDTPDSVQDIVRFSVAGQTVSNVSATAVGSSHAYDGFARRTALTDGRGNTSITHYNGLGQIEYTEDASSNRTSYAYDAVGRRVVVTDVLSNTVHTAYDSEGRVIATWGAAYPAAYAYDLAGRMVAMATTRDPAFDFSAVTNSSILNPHPSLDLTRWLYDHSTGLLTNKVYADGRGTSYSYAPSGRLASRTWARGVTTAYGYDALGQLTNVVYSDGTPKVAYTYDRLGRQTSTVTPVSTNVSVYSGLELSDENQNGVAIKRGYDSAGRIHWLQGNVWEYGLVYLYDDAGRLSTVGSEIIPDGSYSDMQTFEYDYAPGAGLLRAMRCWPVVWWDVSEQTPVTLGWTRSFETQRDLVTAVSNFWNSVPVSSYAYANDVLGRRTARVDSNGSVVKDNAFGYNQRSEVTNAIMGANAYGYVYDPIGNRLRANANGAETEYTSNPLNQYEAVAAAAPAYDADGNMITNGPWAYTWDGENRLASACSNDVLLVTNAYDHQSRRIGKSVCVRESPSFEFQVSRSHTFLYDGWNPIREIVSRLDAPNPPNSLTNYYTWGLDLSGTLQGAGGVGGLLAVTCVSSSTSNLLPLTYYPLYDANGNVTAYLDATGAAAASFEYDAFGNTISEPVAEGPHLPYRFSTKYLDDETGLYYYGYRFYTPEQGRWVSRDPIEESLEYNVYGMVGNGVVDNIDRLGLISVRFLSRKKNNWYQRIKSRGDRYRDVEVSGVDDIYVASGSVSGQHGGFYFPRTPLIDDCGVTVILEILLDAGLTKVPDANVIYTYEHHYSGFDNIEPAGGASGPMGRPQIYDAVLAHERGHASAYLLYVKPCFEKSVKKYDVNNLSSSDVREIEGLYKKCLKDSLDRNIEMSNQATLDYYRSNGFMTTTREGGYYEFKKK